MGVNTDKNPLELNDNELIQAQNATTELTSGRSSMRKREGLIALNGSVAAGGIRGGIGVQLADNVSGVRLMFIGRGTT